MVVKEDEIRENGHVAIAMPEVLDAGYRPGGFSTNKSTSSERKFGKTFHLTLARIFIIQNARYTE